MLHEGGSIGQESWGQLDSCGSSRLCHSRTLWRGSNPTVLLGVALEGGSKSLSGPRGFLRHPLRSECSSPTSTALDWAPAELVPEGCCHSAPLSLSRKVQATPVSAWATPGEAEGHCTRMCEAKTWSSTGQWATASHRCPEPLLWDHSALKTLILWVQDDPERLEGLCMPLRSFMHSPSE
jgi:hypothetical protein